jgi:SAM-dependent methyltransferase
MSSSNKCYVCSGGDLRSAARYGRFEALVCRKCGHQQCSPMPTSEELSFFYENVYHSGTPDRPFGADPCHVERRYELIGTVVAKFAPGAKRLFEMGCSSGYGLGQLKRMGFEVTGSEASAACVEHARSVLGLDVRHGISVPTELYGQFDCAISLHVIEHTPEPFGHVSDLAKAVRPGGWLFVCTPNGTFFPTRLTRMWNWLQPMHHLHVFSPTSLRTLMESAGFEDVKVSLLADCVEQNHLVPILAETLRFGRRHRPETPHDELRQRQKRTERTFAERLRNRIGHTTFRVATAVTFPGYNLLRRMCPAWRETVVAVGRTPE